jgi:glycopeptide antibiotics resistance protein
MGAGMFDDEAPKEKSSTDWTGPIIVAMLAPLFFLFAYLGNAEMGFTACLVLGMFMVAVRLRWKLRRYAWFWATVVFALLLHIPFLFLVHWPQTHVPTLVYSLPLGIADFLLISGAISLAQRVFANGSSDDGEA